MFVNKHYLYLAYNSKSKQCYNEKTSVYFFYEQTKILVDFHICISVHCVKSVQIQSYFWSIFSCNGTNLRIQSEYRKIQARNNSVFGHFSRSGTFNYFHEEIHRGYLTESYIWHIWTSIWAEKNALKINHSFKVNNKDTRTTLLLSL